MLLFLAHRDVLVQRMVLIRYFICFTADWKLSNKALPFMIPVQTWVEATIIKLLFNFVWSNSMQFAIFFYACFTGMFSMILQNTSIAVLIKYGSGK